MIHVTTWEFRKLLQSKGQLISKGLFGILDSSKKRTNFFQINYYDTLWSTCCSSLEEFEDTKNTF